MAAESPRKHLKFVNNVVRSQAFRYVFIKTHLFRINECRNKTFVQELRQIWLKLLNYCKSIYCINILRTCAP